MLKAGAGFLITSLTALMFVEYDTKIPYKFQKVSFFFDDEFAKLCYRTPTTYGFTAQYSR